MPAQLTLAVPSTLTVLAGNASLSSLLGPGPGIVLSGAAASDTISLNLVAGNITAKITSSSAAGATIMANANSLSLSGTQAQVDAALASLSLSEPAGGSFDVLSLSVTDMAGGSVQSALAVDVGSSLGPAFVAPPLLVTLTPDSLTSIPGLLLADPVASALAAMGLGHEETLSLTLAVAQGALLLPGLDALSGIAVSGLGTNMLELSCTADEIGQLNTLLAGLVFAGPSLSGGQNLDYALFNLTGVLPRLVTYGNIFLNNTGSSAANGTFIAGGQTLITGDTNLFGGTLGVPGTLALLGTLANGAVLVTPGAVLEVPDNGMTLSGTSLDFGVLGAPSLSLAGTLLAAQNLSLAGTVQLSAGAQLFVENGFTAGGAGLSAYQPELVMAPGAVLAGSGTVQAGNFSQSGVIIGGTILAMAGETLELDAGLLTGGAVVQAGGGGVIVLGPVSPLYGVFNPTPLTIDNSVTLAFLTPGPRPITGGYADTLGGNGGAFVINGPQVFSGSITGFGAGDQLIFPGLSNMSVFNINTGLGSFSVAGLDAGGTTVTYSIITSIASGLTPSAGTDAHGDAVLFMRPASPLFTEGAALAATPGVPQPLLGLSLELAGSTTQSLTITLTAVAGRLSTGGAYASHVTLTAANIAALNNALQQVEYLGAGVADSLLVSSSTGVLAGMRGSAIIQAGGAGFISGYSGQGVTPVDLVGFGPALGLPIVTQPMAAGGVQVNGLVELDSQLTTQGYSGTGLLVDGGGTAIFGTAAQVSLTGDVTLGDASGAGTLVILTDNYTASGNVTLGATSGGAGSEAAIMGAASIAGTLDVGMNANHAALLLQGRLAAGPVSLGSNGTLQALGTAQAVFGSITNAGTIILSSAASISAAAYWAYGTLDIGGAASLGVAGLLINNNPAGGNWLNIGSSATLAVGSLQAAFGTIEAAGLISATSEIFAGGFLQLDGGTLAAPTLAAATLFGHGLIEAASILVTGTIEAQGGRLLLEGSVNNPSILAVDSFSSLEIAGPASGTPVYFGGTGAELVVDDAAAGLLGVQQMVAGDAVDLVGIAPSLVSVTGNQVGRIYNSQGTQVAMFGIGQSGTAQGNISIVSDGAGGSLLTVGGVLPCFARGTGILSPHGYRPVETLRPQDPVITASGERRAVRWVGWRTLDLGPAAARAAKPVLIMPHAFGRGRPAKMLRLSPSHCIYVAGILIPVMHLVNNATILRDNNAQAATYYHVELDRHDILIAQGLECESYLDDGNRAGLYHELGRRGTGRRACAPIVTSGARLAAVRRTLHETAQRAGFSPTYRPALRAMVAGPDGAEIVHPEITRAGQGRLARFCFSSPVKSLVLFSATACPADTDPESEDRRELGICLGDMSGVVLGAGWHAGGQSDAGAWMGAQAELGLRRARRHIQLRLAAVAPSWVRPPVDGRPASG